MKRIRKYLWSCEWHNTCSCWMDSESCYGEGRKCFDTKELAESAANAKISKCPKKRNYDNECHSSITEVWISNSGKKWYKDYEGRKLKWKKWEDY